MNISHEKWEMLLGLVLSEIVSIAVGLSRQESMVGGNHSAAMPSLVRSGLIRAQEKVNNNGDVTKLQ